MELDLAAVRTFVAVADDLHFGAAADRLGLSQQAVSKRMARLEAGLGVPLLNRAPTGTALTKDGAAFLVHARALVALADRAVAAVRTADRPLRVDVLSTRVGSTQLVRSFHAANEDVEIDIVKSRGLRTARVALLAGTIDAAFARVMGVLEPPLAHTPAYLEPHLVLCGRTHPLAGNRQVRMADLADTITWIPGNEPGSEWADLYESLKSEFDLTLDTTGPLFGLDHMLDHLAASPDRYTFGTERMRIPWHPEIVHIPIVDPTPLYPWSVLWHRDNQHPALPRLIAHLRAGYTPFDPARHWLPPSDRHLFGPA
ncbi:LysR family transcriptional regulator [Actinophytocola sp.]|uniref:LysR family transcriptional regulator n=1 Tax=Actinophytocola sp. TaxID=1872138 RepID=UPI00389A0FE9